MKVQRLSGLLRGVTLVGVLALLLASLETVGLRFVLAEQSGPRLARDLTDTYPFYQEDAIAKAVTYLQTQQLDSGALDAFSFGSAEPTGTLRAILMLHAVGYPTDTLVSSQNKTLIDYLEAEVVNYVYQNDTPATANLFPGRAGQLLAAVAAAGKDPHAFGGVDLIAELNAVYSAAGNGSYSTAAKEGLVDGSASDVNQALAILGLVSAGQPIPDEATDWLLSRQNEGGSWSSSVDTTGFVLVALIGSGNVPPTDAAVQRALDFYKRTQTATTALWGDASGGEPANATGWVISALSTAGFVPTTASWATGGTNPRTALVDLQFDEGAIGANFINAYSTLEALYGLTDQPLFMTTPLRVQRALTWMAEGQTPSGGWGFSPYDPDADPPVTASAGATLDVLLAFVAAGYDPASVTSSSNNSALDYLATAAEDYTRDDSDIIFPAQTGKLIVGLRAAGRDPTMFAGLDLVADLGSTLQATGAYSTTASRGFATGAASATTQAFALLGLAAAGQSIPLEATDFLVSLQQDDGGWGDVDATGIALQALVAAGVPVTNAAVVDGVAYLRESQLATGGWEAFGAFSTNATAYAIQGLLAVGVDLTGDLWLKNGRSAQGVLGSYQKPDGPFVANWDYASISAFYNPTADSLFATQQAVPALLGAVYPYSATTTLATFSPIKRGPDPDRMVAGAASATFSADGQTVLMSVPYGSDLNGDGEVTLEWSVQENGRQLAASEPVTLTRGVGVFTGTLDLSERDDVSPVDTLLLRTTFSDSADGVQDGEAFSTEPVLVESMRSPLRIYLPLVRR